MPGKITNPSKAFFWSFIAGSSNSITQFFISIVLARLILPAEYGLIAMILVFINYSNAFIDSGFGLAIIQKKEIDNQDLSSVFYLNITLSVFFYALLFFTAPLIAAFYGNDIFIDLTRILALNLIINACYIVPVSILKRNLDFKAQSKVGIVSNVISGIIAIYLGYLGFGVWALVLHSMLQNLINGIYYVIISGWIPGKIFNPERLKSLFRFSSKLLASSLIANTIDGLSNILIGKYYSARDLGIYQRANSFRLLPLVNAASIIQRVVLTLFSRAQEDVNKLREGIKKLNLVTSLFVFPLYTYMFLNGSTIIPAVFGINWIDSVVYFELLCIGSFFYLLNVPNTSAYFAIGRSDILLKLETTKKILMLLSLSALYFGIIIFAVVVVFTEILIFFINSYYSGKFFNYSSAAQLKDISHLVLPSACIGLVIYITNILLELNIYLKLSLDIFISVPLYIVIINLIKSPAWEHVKFVYYQLKNKN